MTIPNTTFRAYVEKLGATEAAEYVGNQGDLFYDPNTSSLRVSDGVTAGGVPVAGVTSVGGPIQQSLIPETDGTLDLGSPTKQWRDIYATGNTLYLAGTPLSIDSSGSTPTLQVDGEELATTNKVEDIATSESVATRLIVNTDRKVYTEGAMGVINPNSASAGNAGGWYYRTANSDFIRWNFWTPKPNSDGAVGLLGNLESGWCLFTPWSANSAYPFLQFYTLPKLGLGNAETWYRSRITYKRADEAHTPGTPVLLYFGTDPSVYPGIPRKEMVLDTVNNDGPQEADEFIYSSYVASSTGVADGTYDFSTSGVGFRYSGKNYGYSLYAVPTEVGVTETVTISGVTLQISNGSIVNVT